MGKTKRHHYVPQFYLKNFAVDKPGKTQGFWVYDKDGGEPKFQTPVNTAVKSGLYSVEIPGEDAELLEREVFGKSENAGKPIIDKLQVAESAPSGYERKEMAGFLAVTYARVPRTVELVREMGKARRLEWYKKRAQEPGWVRRMYEGYCRASGEKGLATFEEMEKYLVDPERHFDWEVDRTIALLQSLESSEAVSSVLMRMNWCVCDAPTGRFFITSDVPLSVLTVVDGGRSAVPGSGFGLREAEVLFPISPTRCLVLDWKQNQERVQVSGERVDDINRRIACVAEQYIISPFRGPDIERLRSEFACTRQMPKVDREVVARLLEAAEREERGGRAP